MEGNSVCCHVHGFVPYFFVTAPNGFNESHVRPFKEALNRVVMADLRSNKDGLQEAVVKVEMTWKQNMFGYRGDEAELFLKITVTLPKLIAACKRLLEKESVFPALGNHFYSPFESNIDIDIR